MCLGDVLTKMQVFLFLTSLVQSYELKLPESDESPTLTGTIAVSVVPKPFRVSLVPRQLPQVK